MIAATGDGSIDDAALRVSKRRARVILLLDAAERAGVAPLSTARLHAFAYLADVLSPVWDLPVFDSVVLKEIGGPYYTSLQREADRLVVAGLLEVSELRYDDRPRDGARIFGLYGLRFGSEHLERILAALGARDPRQALDAKDVRIHEFLVELAGALARLQDDEIDHVASVDATYADHSIFENNLVYLNGEMGAPNLSVATAERFNEFLPEGVNFSPGEKLYLYATYLGRRVHAG
jgi:hypothetical protein